MKLYIVGNGFDLSHGLKTSYKDFRLYLLEHKDEIYADGDLTISKEEILYKFEEYCQPNELWSDFEQQTENIISEISEKKISIFGEEWDCRLDPRRDLSRFIDKFTDEIVKSNSSTDIYVKHNLIKDFALNHFNDVVKKEYIWIPYLYVSFQEWIQTITVEHTKKIYEIEENSAVVSFNYTNTMEEVYQQNEVLHLHGFVRELEELVLGFHSKELDEKLPGLETSFTKEHKEMQKASAENGLKSPDSNKFHDENIRRFYKPVNLLKDLIESFVKNKNIHEVITLGHSYNKIDWVYFKEIIRCVPEAKYLFSYFSQNDRENIKNMIFDNKFDVNYDEIHVGNFKIKEY